MLRGVARLRQMNTIDVERSALAECDCDFTTHSLTTLAANVARY